jgi:hypothetical protein
MATFLPGRDQQGNMMYSNCDDISCIFVNDDKETEICFQSDPEGCLIAKDAPEGVIRGALLHLGTD